MYTILFVFVSMIVITLLFCILLTIFIRDSKMKESLDMFIDICRTDLTKVKMINGYCTIFKETGFLTRKKFVEMIQDIYSQKSKLCLDVSREKYIIIDKENSDEWIPFNLYKFGYTSDIILYDRDKEEVILIERDKPPFKGCLAIPGGFVEHLKEKSKEAGVRELKEEINVRLEESQLHFLDLYDDPKRDPRGHVISTVYFVFVNFDEITFKAGDDAKAVVQIKLSDALTKDLAFDHGKILSDFCMYMKVHEKIHNKENVLC